MDDRRTRKTKKAIRESLAELMLEKSIKDITIKELSDRADISRVTFYTHYTDIYDLYEQLSQSVLDDFEEILNTYELDGYEKIWDRIIEYIIENKKVLKMALCGENCPIFQQRLSDLIERKYLEISMLEEHTNVLTKTYTYIARYHIYGLIALIAKWLDDDMAFPLNEFMSLVKRIDESTDPVFYEPK